MDVYTIVKQYLEENGFTALCNDECGCCHNDLMPCLENISIIYSCYPGYVNYCASCGKSEKCPYDKDKNWDVVYSGTKCWVPKEADQSKERGKEK